MADHLPMTDVGRDAALRALVEQKVERALAFVAEFKGDGRCALNCLYAEALAAEVHRLRDEIATAREACPSIRMQDHFDASLLELVNLEVSRGFNRDAEIQRLAALLASPDPVVGAVPDPQKRFEFDRDATAVLSLALRKIRMADGILDPTYRALADVLQETFDSDLVKFNRQAPSSLLGHGEEDEDLRKTTTI